MRTGRSWARVLPAAALTLALATGCTSENADEPDAEPTAAATGPKADVISPDYPRRDVPLVEGEVLLADTSETRSTVTVLVQGQHRPALDRAVRRLEGRGLEVRQRRDTRAGSVAVLVSRRFRVEVSATPTGDQTSLTYVVERCR